MSNKTQLQTNNTKYASLIETLRGKAAGGGGSGGGSITTTRVMVDNYLIVFATTYDDVDGFGYAVRTPSGGPVVIANAVSGSCLVVIHGEIAPTVSGATFIFQYMVSEMEGIWAYLYQVN